MLLISHSPTSHLAYPGPAPTILLGVKTLCFSSPGCSRQHQASSWPYAETLVGRASCFLLPKLFHSPPALTRTTQQALQAVPAYEGQSPKRSEAASLLALPPLSWDLHKAPSPYRLLKRELTSSAHLIRILPKTPIAPKTSWLGTHQLVRHQDPSAPST